MGSSERMDLKLLNPWEFSIPRDYKVSIGDRPQPQPSPAPTLVCMLPNHECMYEMNNSVDINMARECV